MQHYLASPAGACPAVRFKAGYQGDNRKNAAAFEGTDSVYNVDKTVYDTFPLKTEYFLTEKGKAVLKALEIYQKIGIDYMIEAG